MTFYEVPPVHLNESVELKAAFQNVSRYDRLSVIWVKHDPDINIPHRKYEVVIDQKGSAVLRINNLKREDVGTYTVEVHNKFGKGQSSQKLEVIRGILHFKSRFILRDKTKITHFFFKHLFNHKYVTKQKALRLRRGFVQHTFRNSVFCTTI